MKPKRQVRVKGGSRKIKFITSAPKKSRKTTKTINVRKHPITADYLTNAVTTNYVKKNCEDSGLCLLLHLGIQSRNIKKMFNNFLDFEYAIGRNRIGDTSGQGFVNEIIFQRNNYTAYTILKSSLQMDSDNLWYEYLIGVHINKHYYHNFSCFVETYAAYRYQQNVRGSIYPNKEDMQRNNNMRKPLSKMLSLIPYSEGDSAIIDSCSEPDRSTVLIQHIHNAIELNKMMNSNDCETFIKNDLIGCLFQIYFSLSHLSRTFTHNDLHTRNVLLCPLPISNTYLVFRFHCADNTIVSFKSKYIAKIIDYGQCYVHSLSETTYETSKHKCKNYKYRKRVIDDSIDLRLLKALTPFLNKYSVLYPDLVTTIEGFKSVVDAESGLRQMLLENTKTQLQNSSFYSTDLQLGEIDIFGDKVMQFNMTINEKQLTHRRSKKNSFKNVINNNYESPTKEDIDSDDIYELRFVRTRIDDTWTTDLYDSSGKYLGLGYFINQVNENIEAKGRRQWLGSYLRQYLTNFYERRKYKNYSSEAITKERHEELKTIAESVFKECFESKDEWDLEKLGFIVEFLTKAEEKASPITKSEETYFIKYYEQEMDKNRLYDLVKHDPDVKYISPDLENDENFEINENFGSHSSTGSSNTRSHSSTGSSNTRSHSSTGSSNTRSHSSTGSSNTRSHSSTGKSNFKPWF